MFLFKSWNLSVSLSKLFFILLHESTWFLLGCRKKVARRTVVCWSRTGRRITFTSCSSRESRWFLLHRHTAWSWKLGCESLMSPTRYPFDMKTSSYLKMWRRNYDITTFNFMYWHFYRVWRVSCFDNNRAISVSISTGHNYYILLRVNCWLQLKPISFHVKSFGTQTNYLQEEISEKKTL